MTTAHNVLRWHSRRGMLELDLMLEQFWHKTGTLSDDEARALTVLLEQDDILLWRTLRTFSSARHEDDEVNALLADEGVKKMAQRLQTGAKHQGASS